MTLYLFDVDGTLLLSGGAGKRALERVFFDRYGLPEALAGIHPGGMTDPLIVERMFEKLGRTPERAEIALVLAAYERALPQEIADSPSYRLMPGAREVVTHLFDRGAALALATGNTQEGARIKLERGDLWRYFPVGGYGSDHRDRAALIRVAMARAEAHLGRGFPPEEVLVIGDTPADVAAARAVGARVAAVATGSSSLAELSAAGPDEVYPTLLEMLPRLG